MAKTTTPPPDAPDRTSVAQATDVLGKVAAARREADASRPIASTRVDRPGIGRPGRKSGGTFALKRLVIAHVENVDTGDPAAPKIIDREDKQMCRELCVHLHMEPSKYPTIQPFEVVMEEYHDEYYDEFRRDAILSRQVDPYATDEDGNAVGPKVINLGPTDWGKLNKAGGGTWMGKAGLQTTV